MSVVLDEPASRRFAAAEATAARHGGLATVFRLTGIARWTILRGQAELASGEEPGAGRIRCNGGGRLPISAKTAGVMAALQTLLDPVTRGDLMQPLCWTSKSPTKLARNLRKQGCRVTENTARVALIKLGYSRQANRKSDEGSHHPDRKAQFEYVAGKGGGRTEDTAAGNLGRHKKERISNDRKGGTDYCPKGQPIAVKVHNFEDKILGKVAPYAIYDVTATEGGVSVGVTKDTFEFAIETIRTGRAPGKRALCCRARRAGVELIGSTAIQNGPKVSCAIESYPGAWDATVHRKGAAFRAARRSGWHAG